MIGIYRGCHTKVCARATGGTQQTHAHKPCSFSTHCGQWKAIILLLFSVNVHVDVVATILPMDAGQGWQCRPVTLVDIPRGRGGRRVDGQASHQRRRALGKRYSPAAESKPGHTSRKTSSRQRRKGQINHRYCTKPSVIGDCENASGPKQEIPVSGGGGVQVRTSRSGASP